VANKELKIPTKAKLAKMTPGELLDVLKLSLATMTEKIEGLEKTVNCLTMAVLRSEHLLRRPTSPRQISSKPRRRREPKP
jgi:hypothetical protein